MATFASITRGPKQRRRIKLPLQGATVDPATGEWTGAVAELDICGLGPLEIAEIVQRARVFAKKYDVAEPTDDDEIYEWGKKLHTLLVTCLDPESPADAPRPFFDGGIDQISKSEILSAEHIAYLYDQQQLFQEESAPGLKDMSSMEFLAAVIKTAGGDLNFFVNARPGMRWSFTRTLAALHLSSLTQKSASSSSPAESTRN